MISTVVIPRGSPDADLLNPSIRPGSSDELLQLRARCEHLSLAVTALSHELRQGFHTLLGCIDKCGGTVQSQGGQTHVKGARGHIYRLTAELESLAALAVLAGAQSSHMFREAVAVQPILAETYAHWQLEARKKGIRIRMVLDEVTVLSNARWLGIMISNIVGNAVRHSNSGEVCIEGKVRVPDLILTVRDSGPGIEEREMRRAFDNIPPPRWTGHGLGLGLSIVRRAAELLGHGLGIRSTPFRGTAVCLRMQIVQNGLARS